MSCKVKATLSPLVQVRTQDQETLALVNRVIHLENYIYPAIINIRNTHKVYRDQFLETLNSLTMKMREAASSNSLSRIYLVDNTLKELKTKLRFLSHKNRRLVSTKRARRALIMLSNLGCMVGSWIRRLRHIKKAEDASLSKSVAGTATKSGKGGSAR